jgi:hypothetical protein
MENKTSWEWHKEKHVGDHYTTIRNKSTQQRFQDGPLHVASTYTLTPNNYDHKKHRRTENL